MAHRISKLPRLRSVMFAVAAALAAHTSASAQVVVTDMLAVGDWQMDGGSLNTLFSVYPSSNPVDVLDFQNTINSSVGLHTYGNTSGNFGSRSSGSGVYNVAGWFAIAMSIENTSAIAQQATFSFYITPGQVSTAYAGLSAGQFVGAGLFFDIQRNAVSKWSSGFSLYSDSTGNTPTQTGVNLYTGSERFYGIAGGNYAVDLGVIGAGETISLSYTLDTFARGNAVTGSGVMVPEQTFVVPDQWVDFCGNECGYGYGNLGELVPGEIVTVPAHELPGHAGQLARLIGRSFHD